jgi:hypothetical protein
MPSPSTVIRATKDLDVLVRAVPDNATRVYRALAAFGAPLASFEVAEADFATYDGVLQIGLPPRRIDILNRATGITFDEAVADGDFIDIEGRVIPMIGRDALLNNKRATARDQVASGDHTCVLLTNNAIKCWGRRP